MWCLAAAWLLWPWRDLLEMRVLPNGDVILKQGEPVPCLCECGEVYPVAEHSEWSRCPCCGRENVHHACKRSLRIKLEIGK